MLNLTGHQGVTEAHILEIPAGQTIPPFRMALEEVLLQGPNSFETESSPMTVRGKGESLSPSTTVEGMTLKSGDILLSRGGAPTSALIARGNDYPGSFSHVALVHIDAQTGRASVIESHIEQGVVISSMEQYLADKKLRIVVLRLRADLPEVTTSPGLPHRAAEQMLGQARARHIPYDFAMDYREHSAQFCSEVVAAAYEGAGIELWKGTTLISSSVVVAWLGSLGVRHFETQEPADLEYDPQLEVVGEWRDNQTLFKAHVDDAVIDVTLEKAKPGQPLPQQRWLLPVVRCAKAYSVLLNLAGKAGPIPEGMSATTALRVNLLRKEHHALAERVLKLAAGFKATKGYTPPFWELHRMAEETMATSNQ